MQVAMTGSPACVMPDAPDPTPASSSGSRAGDLWGRVFQPQPQTEHLWNIARDCLENIGTLRRQRKPLPHENWRAPFKAEQRLVEQIDAVIACGPRVIQRAIDYVREAEIPDAEWAFAVMLLLGCISGEETLGSAVELLEFLFARDQEEGRAGAEALALAAHPGIFKAVAPLLDRGTANLRLGIAQLLYRRGELTREQTSELARCGEPELMAIALFEMAESGCDFQEEDWARLLGHDSENVERAAMGLSFTRREPAGRRRALEWIAAECPEYARSIFWLGLAGEYQDWPVLEKLLAANASPLVVASVGYWGYAEAVPALLKTLKQVPEKRRAGVSFAIERITGAGFTVWDRESQELRLGAVDEYERWWTDAAADFSPRIRFRRGRRFGPDVLLAEIDDGTHSAEERATTHLEMIRLAQGSPPRFRADDFIRRQELRVMEWKRLFGIKSGA